VPYSGRNIVSQVGGVCSVRPNFDHTWPDKNTYADLARGLTFCGPDLRRASHPFVRLFSSEYRINSSICLGLFSSRLSNLGLGLGLAGIGQGILPTLDRDHGGKAGPAQDAAVFVHRDFSGQVTGRAEVLDNLGCTQDGVGGLDFTLGGNSEDVSGFGLAGLGQAARPAGLLGVDGARGVRGGGGSYGRGGVLHGGIIPQLFIICLSLVAQNKIKGLMTASWVTP